jgi:hypothetical protein
VRDYRGSLMELAGYLTVGPPTTRPAWGPLYQEISLVVEEALWADENAAEAQWNDVVELLEVYATERRSFDPEVSAGAAHLLRVAVDIE